MKGRFGELGTWLLGWLSSGLGAVVRRCGATKSVLTGKSSERPDGRPRAKAGN